jgi:hypothetical protein
MKQLALLLCTGLLLMGCATTSRQRVEKRKQERSNAYAALPPEQKAAVDAGKVEVGMNMDAVYIAWGRPSQVLEGEGAQGHVVTWIYQGTYYQPYSYWTYSAPWYWGYGRYYDPGPHFAYDYHPVPYVRGEVYFERGVVKQWQTFASPHH